MLKNAKVRAWLEGIINGIDELNLNTDLELTFIQQAAKHGTPVATVSINRGSVAANGQHLVHQLPADILIVERVDGDYEQVMQDLFDAIEGEAFPNFVESGDANSSPGVVDRYEWEVYPQASEGKFAGKIIVRVTVFLKYSNISSRM